MRLEQMQAWVACGLLPLLLLQVHGQDSSSPIRTTSTGQVQGSLVHMKGTDVGVHSFLGIPFAKPPLGPLRFAPPEPPEPWDGVRDGTSHPVMCLQDITAMNTQALKLLNLTLPPIPMSEDCLYLNIYTPAYAHEGSNLPVMVWIHGGALVIGMASLYDGSMLAAIEGVVVVTIQYRLGVLGFFSTGDQHARGNWGYLDQVAALRWVQQNIAHFGGNPDRVTIFGESAGGTSVSSHVVSPLSQGLFHGAVMESGVALLPSLISNSSEAVYKMVANLSGCEQDVNSEALVGCLRGKSEEEILAINKAFKIIPGIVDGIFLPRHPKELLASADFHPVPSIIGINNDEYGWIIPLGISTTDSQKKIDRQTVQAALQRRSAHMKWPPEVNDLLMEKYLGDTEDPQILQAQFQEMMEDLIFVIPALQVAQFQRSRAPVYFYEFQHRPNFFKDVKPPYVKADHGDEIIFIFRSFWGGTQADLTEEEELLSRRMMKYWANFARHGNPNGEGLPHWPVFDQNEHYLQLDIQTAVGHALKACILHTQEPLVVTKDGILQGKQIYVRKTPIHVFLGIPFSKPPLGNRRFAPPEPLEPWDGIRDATTYPPSCLQETWGQITSMYLNTRKQYKWLRFSEDCLYINVYAPVHAPGDPPLPVMVWFPGGAFLVGSASTYEGSELAAREKVVLVFLQYRLGILGFFSTGDSQARGNWGLLDQIAALHWVQENIEAFGGDRNSVTLFGQSAGAMSISGQLMSPLAQGLFHRAISQSGTAIMKVFITRDPLKVAKKVAHMAGCNHNSTRIMVECLRALSGAQVMHVSKRMAFFHINIKKDPKDVVWFLSPVVDGVVFPEDPVVLLTHGQVTPVPYLLGINNLEFEWTLPFLMKFQLTLHLMNKKLLTRFLWSSSTLLNITKEQVPLVMEEYLNDAANKHDWKMFRKHLIDLVGDATFVYSTLQAARYHRDAGIPVYLYEYEHHTPGIIVKPRTDGADHGDELSYIFGSPFSKGSPTGEEKAFSLQMMKYWANFARTGNPNDKKLPYWPLFEEDEKYLLLDFTTRVGVNLKEKKMAFWGRLHQPPSP